MLDERTRRQTRQPACYAETLPEPGGGRVAV